MMKEMPMNHKIFALFAIFLLAAPARADDLYLFYSASSDNLDELGITPQETADIFDGEFGPASDELPLEVRFDDFYVAKYPDQNFVFILNAPFNCGQLGCNTIVFGRDEDGDLVELDSAKPVKCKIYDSDKLVCTEGGYKPEITPAKPKKKILHFPVPTDEPRF